MKSIRSLAATLLVLVPAVAPAGTTVVEPMPPGPAVTTTHDDWVFTLGLYGWGAGLEGDVGAAGNVVPIDISFSDILDTLDMTAMGMFEVRKGRWLFQLEGLYLRNSIRAPAITPGGIPGTAKLTAKTTRLEPVFGYRMIENERTSLDLLAGAVWYDISNEIGFIGTGAVGGAVESGDDWLDPIVGLRLRHFFTDHWGIVLRGEIGGFGVNADLTWQAAAMLAYRVNPSIVLFGGWRHAAVDYSSGGFVYDVASTGPILGATFDF